MSEYKKMVDLMVSENKELFDNFKEIHDEYVLDPPKWQKIFNQYGAEVVDIIRIYERRLCIKMGNGKYGKFSEKLVEKFWEEVKKTYSKIHFIGVQESR